MRRTPLWIACAIVGCGSPAPSPTPDGADLAVADAREPAPRDASPTPETPSADPPAPPVDLTLPKIPKGVAAGQVAAHLWLGRTGTWVVPAHEGDAAPPSADPLSAEAVETALGAARSGGSSSPRVRLHIDAGVEQGRLTAALSMARTAGYREAELTVETPDGSAVVLLGLPPKRLRAVSTKASRASVVMASDGSAILGVSQLAADDRLLAGPVVPLQSQKAPCPAPAETRAAALVDLVSTLCARESTRSVDIDVTPDDAAPVTALVELLAERPWPKRCRGQFSIAFGGAARAARRTHCKDALAVDGLEAYFEQQLAIAATRAKTEASAPLPPDEPELDALLDDLDPEDFKALGEALESGANTGHLGLGELGPSRTKPGPK